MICGHMEAEDIIEDGKTIKELTRVLPTTDLTTLRDEITYENLIIFDREKEVVQEEMQALAKMNQSNQCLQMYSDGSVKIMLKAGTYVWMVAKKNQAGKLVRSKIRAIGKEVVSQIECARIHSYRAEAIGLLSGLKFLQHVEWKGQVKRHTDS